VTPRTRARQLAERAIRRDVGHADAAAAAFELARLIVDNELLGSTAKPLDPETALLARAGLVRRAVRP
jgi:hypothetical protein